MNKLIHLLNKLKELNIDKLEDFIEEDDNIKGQIFESLWKLIFLTNNYKNIDNYVMCMGRIESSTIEIRHGSPCMGMHPPLTWGHPLLLHVFFSDNHVFRYEITHASPLA